MTEPQTSPGSPSAPQYAAAGVDVDANDRLIPRYRQLAQSAVRPEQLGGVGPFSGLFDLSRWDNPVLVASTDGVGTKVMIATLAGRLDGVGRDLVNHCINDILTAGAEPLFFLDYLAAHELSEDDKVTVVSGVAEACRESGVALLGGETADMPDLYPSGGFDLAGTIIGVVERGRQVTGEQIAPGDVLIALPSNGLHTNGYTLARSALRLRPGDAPVSERRARLLAHEPALGESLADALLRPHTPYWTALQPLLGRIKGIAHITGGGIAGNLERILPPGTAAELTRGTWSEPPIFGLIQQRGSISDEEMLRVFNLGVGLIVVASTADAVGILNALAEHEATQIGQISTQTNADSPLVTIDRTDRPARIASVSENAADVSGW